MGCGTCFALRLPFFLVLLGGFAVEITGVLALLKLQGIWAIEWWVVVLPVAVMLGVCWFALFGCILIWLHVVLQLCMGVAEPEADHELRLDMLLATAKTCFLSHGYVTLLCLAMALLIAKLHLWPSLPIIYPLLPLIILGAVYIFMATMLKKPEIDVEWCLFVGTVLLLQSLMLVVKLEHYQDSSHFAWAAVFIPSWLAYAMLLFFCMRTGSLSLLHLSKEWGRSNNRAGDDEESRLVSPNDRGRTRPLAKIRSELFTVGGIAIWVVGFASSQICLALRLDDVWKAPWYVVLLPGLVSWLILVVSASSKIGDHFRELAQSLLDALGVLPLDIDMERSKDPLLPWR